MVLLSAIIQVEIIMSLPQQGVAIHTEIITPPLSLNVMAVHALFHLWHKWLSRGLPLLNRGHRELFFGLH